MSDTTAAKQNYLRELELSRLALHRDLHALRDECNVVKKVKSVVARKPLWWLGGAALLGFVFSARRRTVRVERVLVGQSAKDAPRKSASVGRRLTFWGFLFAALKSALPLLRPVVSAYASKRLAELALTVGR